jgi:hypothetical protein
VKKLRTWSFEGLKIAMRNAVPWSGSDRVVRVACGQKHWRACASLHFIGGLATFLWYSLCNHGRCGSSRSSLR